MRARQGALHRLLEFLRLAPDEVTRGVGEIRPRAPRRAPGILFAHRPRVRMGTDAARARPESRRGRVESARDGPARRQDPPRPAAAESQPAATTPARSQDHAAGGARSRSTSVVDALDAVAKETGKTVPQIAINWVLQRPTVSTVIIGARDEAQLQQNFGGRRLGADAGPDRAARCGECEAADLPVLAPGAVRAE